MTLKEGRQVIIGKIGDLAYLDTYRSGLVPCKVTEINPRSVTVKVTADRRGYSRGEIVDAVWYRVTPRTAVRLRRSQFTIRPFRWEGQDFGSSDYITSNIAATGQGE